MDSSDLSTLFILLSVAVDPEYIPEIYQRVCEKRPGNPEEPHMDQGRACETSDSNLSNIIKPGMGRVWLALTPPPGLQQGWIGHPLQV